MSKAEICRLFLELSYKHFRKEKITDSHQIQWHNVISSEWGISKREIDGKTYLVVAICGSNDWIDWVMNVDLRTIFGFKWSGWWEARRIFKSIKKANVFNIPVILAGHSKSGATLPPLLKKLNKAGIEIDSIHSFEPATCLKWPYKIEKMIMYIDPDDIIPDLGKPILHHPICDIVKHPGGKSGNDHSLSNWDGFLS